MQRNRATAALLVSGLLLSLSSSAFAFSDVGGTTPYGEAINALKVDGVVEGYADGTFLPKSTINRAEFVKIIVYAVAGEEEADACRNSLDAGTARRLFADVTDDGQALWFYPVICVAKKRGWVHGYPDGFFRPGNPVNFVEAAKILTLAYGQTIDQYSPDWYEPYARALESSSAIPPSIDSLDKKLTRGEMAEMMWRLKEQITDEPAKGYLNVKYPEMGVNMASERPERATSCADLRVFTEEAGRAGGGTGMMQGTMERDMETLAPQMGMSESKASDYSQTNVQVAGVDEGDIVKTDGEYLYVVHNQEIRIVDVGQSSALRNVATIRVDDAGFTPSDLYIVGDRLVVIGSTWEGGGGVAPMMEKMIWPGPWYNRSFTVVRIYDISNPEDPELSRTVSFEGSQVSTRRIDDHLYVVVNQNPRYFGEPVPLPAVREGDVVPMVEDSVRGGAEPAVRCAEVTILPRVPSPSYLIVGVVPLWSDTAEVRRTAVLGNGENVYASLENLYVAATDWRLAWDTDSDVGQRTRLYRFAFTSDGVGFNAQGSVPGRILNQFSMDEHMNHFRIATTIDSQWSPDGMEEIMSNNLYVLNRSMEIVGSIEDIAPGERIYSTRFLGNRAYMVTFRTIDPLFVIDTSDPRDPKILGKLKIPGYSDYLHPYDENHILGFGKETVESKDGSFAWYQGMKIALFDVRDVAHPVERSRMIIGDRGTESPLLQNHKALLFERDRDLLAFPVRIHKISDAVKQEGDPNSAWGDPIFQGAHVYSLSLEDGFTLRGTITHYTSEDWLKSGYQPYGKDIERIVRVGDSLLTVSPWGVQSHSEEDIDKEGSVLFDIPSSSFGGECPDDQDPDVHYVSKDPDSCARTRFACLDNQKAFSDACGCGCKPISS